MPITDTSTNSIHIPQLSGPNAMTQTPFFRENNTDINSSPQEQYSHQHSQRYVFRQVDITQIGQQEPARQIANRNDNIIVRFSFI